MARATTTDDPFAVSLDDRRLAISRDDRRVSRVGHVRGDGDVRRGLLLQRIAKSLSEQSSDVHGHGPVVVVVGEVVVVVVVDVVEVVEVVDELAEVDVVDSDVVVVIDDPVSLAADVGDEVLIVVVVSVPPSVGALGTEPSIPRSDDRALRCSARRSLYNGASPCGRRRTDAVASEIVPRSPGLIGV